MIYFYSEQQNSLSTVMQTCLQIHVLCNSAYCNVKPHYKLQRAGKDCKALDGLVHRVLECLTEDLFLHGPKQAVSSSQ